MTPKQPSSAQWRVKFQEVSFAISKDESLAAVGRLFCVLGSTILQSVARFYRTTLRGNERKSPPLKSKEIRRWHTPTNSPQPKTEPRPEQPEREAAFIDLITRIEERRGIDRSDTPEARLVQVMTNLEKHVKYGRLSLKAITDEFNKDKPEKFRSSERTIGARLTALGFEKRRSTSDGATAVLYDEGLIKNLSHTYLGTPSVSSVSSVSSKRRFDAALSTEASTEDTEASKSPSVSPSVKTSSVYAGSEGTEDTEAKNRGVSKKKNESSGKGIPIPLDEHELKQEALL